MNCISPPEPEDRLLMALLDGEVNPELDLHLQQCPYCRERVEALAREQNILTSRLFRVSCPSAAELGEYHLHMLVPSQMLIVSQHVRECLHCKREMDQLKEFLSDLAPSADGNFFRQAKILVARMVSGGEGASPAGEPFFALRGKSEGPLTFEAEGIVIVLDIQSANKGMVSILGQVAAEDQEQWTGATVTLQQIDESHTTYLDDLGAFRFEETLSGHGQITITSLQGIQVKIPNINIDV